MIQALYGPVMSLDEPVATAPARPQPGGVTEALLRRWPTWLALAWAALTLSDVGDGTELSFVLVVAGFGYLAVTVLERPGATWPLVFLVLGGVVTLRATELDEGSVLIAVGAVLAVVGLTRGSLRRPGPASLQIPAALVFVGAGVLGAAVDPDVGLYVVAAGLIGHAAWDAYHWWADRIVVRSFAEWCGVLDLTLGVGILLLV